MKRKICIITGTRADWGLLSPIAKALNENSDAELQIIATNMHLLEQYGYTARQIEDDGFHIDKKVAVNPKSDTIEMMATILTGTAEALRELKPDLVVILGDRFEMMSAATACTILRLPVAHIAGGTISEGAIDDSIRHCISKMSHIHLTETEESRQRVIQLGENPENVHNVGAIGVWSITQRENANVKDVCARVGLPVGENTLAVTFHPSTLDNTPAKEQFSNLLKALDEHHECNIVFTYPNNDPYGEGIIELIDNYVRTHTHRAVAHASLGQKLYFNLLEHCGAVVGNSSSGIVEAPSFGIPTLNIGMRQNGRTAATSVYNCGVSKEEISSGLTKILSKSFRQTARQCRNPYQNPDTLQLILNALLHTPLEGITQKHFFDIA